MESAHTSPLEPEGWLSLVGSQAQAEEALRKDTGQHRTGLSQPQN